MKKLGGVIVSGCLLAALAAGPAAASTGSNEAEPVPCEAIFSEDVCNALGDASGTVRDVVDRLPSSVDEVRQLILFWADCIVHQTCIATAPLPSGGARSQTGPCEIVFSPGICSRVEDPVGTVQYAYDTFIRCYLDPACTPTPTICIDITCIIKT